MGRMSNSVQVLNSDFQKKSSSVDEKEKGLEEARLHRCIVTVMSPLFNYARLIGLSHYSRSTAVVRFLVPYSILVILVLCSFGILKLIKLRYDGLTVAFAFQLMNAFFIVSGAAAAIFLYLMHKNLQSLNECTMREISSQQEPEDVVISRLRKKSQILVAVIIIVSIVITASTVGMYVWKLVRQHSIIPNLPLAAQILIEAYITFMTQSSLMICAIFFVVFCNVIRQSFNKLIADMQWLGIDLAAVISPKAALEVLRKLQQRFQHLKEAADVVDGQFSIALLYLCAWTLLALCFILYSYLKDSDIQATALQIVVLVSWNANVLSIFLLVTIPAYKVHEKNGEVLKLCLKMFENHIYDENNASLTNCILMFAETVKMGPANFTAGGFFVITRSLLLTMASFTATYLIILLQSTTNVVCQLPAEFVSQYETPRTTVGPLDT